MIRERNRRRTTWLAAAGLVLAASPALAQAPAAGELPVRWEELTAPDFAQAVERSAGTAIVPIGVIEKHGPHLPLGTDLLDAREVALRAVRKEYSIVFPPYYFSQIFEAKHQPGTVAYGARLIWDVLQETVDEIARNGIKKIVLVNGHGGNNSFLPFFCQSQLARRKDYAVYLFQPSGDAEADARVKALRKTAVDMHAGEVETSTVLAHRPDLAHPERAREQSGADQARLGGLTDAYTAIWWYSRFPNHYAGDGSPARPELGNLVLDHQAGQLVEMIRAVKADAKVLELQNRFFDEAEAPLRTPQK
ncbi:MAG TPA: creatininase family protein [Vicinamibacteria bacterium]|nr:creatininase family protein [Vicinamibacteria bacterium]